MAKFVHSDVLDSGINVIKANATRMLLVKAYTIGDAYATVDANKVCEVLMTTAAVGVVSGDYTLANGATGSRTLTSATKTGTASLSSGSAPNLHIAFLDATRILWVTDETSDQVITAGNTINFPAIVYTSVQPT